MGKTGKKLPKPAVPTMDEWWEMAHRICQEADGKEARYLEVFGSHDLAAKVLYEVALDRQEYGLEVMCSQHQANSERHRQIVNCRHDQKRGTREKRRRIREQWRTGKFRTKEQCAEKCCGQVGISFSTAQKALKNEPAPANFPEPAVDWLRDRLAGSSPLATEVYREAKVAGYSKDAMKRAKDALGVAVTKQGRNSSWRL